MGSCASRPAAVKAGAAAAAPATAACPAAKPPAARTAAKPPLPAIQSTLPSVEDEALFLRAKEAAAADKSLPVGAPPPTTEPQRIKALHQLGSLGDGVESDERLNSIVELLRSTFAVNMAAVTLIDVDRQWFIAAAGVDLGSIDRQTALGSWALGEDAAMLVVEDALQDARFKSNPLVTSPPHVRFYAAAPLIGSDGAKYGVLGIADRQPRRFAAEQLSILSGFAELAVRTLEETRLPELQQHAAAAEKGCSAPLVRSLDKLEEAVLLCSLETDCWEIRWANARFAALAGVQQLQHNAHGSDLRTLFQVAGDLEAVLAECDVSIFCKLPFTVTVQLPGQPGDLVELRFRPAPYGLPTTGIPAIGIPGFVDSELGHATHDVLASGLEHLYWVQCAAAGSGAALDTRSGAAAVPRFAASTRGARACGGADAPPKLPSRGLSFTLAGGGKGRARAISFNVPTTLDLEAVFQKVTLGPLLGSGAYGRVYRALWRGVEAALASPALQVMDYWCPLTELTQEVATEKHSALLEALLGREFTRHPALVQTYDLGLRPADPVHSLNPPTGPVRHTLWLVTELCNRGTLTDAVRKGRFRLTPSDAASGPNMLSILLTAREVAGGMSLLHDHGILHSDLSANNVLLKAAANSRRFTVSVSDFGLSRVCTDADGKHTQTVGTVTHQPPELLTEGLVTSAADVWAFGVLLWTMYTGEQPYFGELPTAIICKVASCSRCPLELPEDAPHGFKDLFERCVARYRYQRPTFHEILALLVPLVEKAEAEAPPPSPWAGSPGRSAFKSSPSFRMREA
ncbi:hypothetical protein ABPG75_012237 [Micractinium tetrahymenae]